MSLVHRQKERALLEWAVAYLAAGWPTLEVLGFLAEDFFWPPAIETEERAAGERP